MNQPSIFNCIVRTGDELSRVSNHCDEVSDLQEALRITQQIELDLPKNESPPNRGHNYAKLVWGIVTFVIKQHSCKLRQVLLAAQLAGGCRAICELM